jgi:hypothetical protein
MTNPVTAFKSLAPSEYTVTPFAASSPFSYTYVSGSSTNSNDVRILYGKKYVTSSVLRSPNDEYDLFDSVVQSFYSPLPYTQQGIQSSSYHPTGSVFVISITQDVFGEEIKPGTVSIVVGTSSSYDDTKGNLFISQSGTAYFIGQVFYDKGVILVKPTSSIAGGGLTSNGICIVSGTNVQVNFTSSVTLHEHAVRVRLNPTDFNFSVYNPSIDRAFYTGSVETPLQSMTSRSMEPSNTTYLAPYVTTIGLFNPNNELVAIGKLSNPIQRTFDSIQTFVVKFDT